MEKNGHDNDDNGMLNRRHESDKQSETNVDNMRTDHDNSDELENIYANTQIYVNTNMLGTNDYANANCTIPVGRRPALPPKPSSQVHTLKIRNRSTTATATATGRQTMPRPNNEYPMQKDPAEMSLKERLAMFEQSTRTMKADGIVIAPKMQTPSAPMTLPKKQSAHAVRTTESAAIIHANLSNEFSKSK